MALPVLPVQGQNPWFTPRNNWDLAVKNDLEGRLSETGLQEIVGHITVPESASPSDLASLIAQGVSSGRPVVFSRKATYNFTTSIAIDMTPGSSLDLDLNGSTLNFTSGAGMRIGLPYISSAPASYKSSILSSGVVRGSTSFTVDDPSGIEKGDLIVVSSPVVITGSVRMEQTYTVGYVDGSTVYVDGIIVGDITPAQIAAAGLTGNVSASFYKLGRAINLKNGVIRSSNKSSADVLLLVTGFQEVSLGGLTFDNPYRNGVNVSWSGRVLAKDITSIDSGYVYGDQGYVSIPSAPGGLSFGYGILATRCYSVRVTGMNAYRGWHGVDFALGVTYGIVQDSVFHKCAYGVSSHESSWIMSVNSSHFVGGVGVTSRSFELMVTDNEFYSSKQGAIAGHRTHHRLLISNNDFNMGVLAGSGWLSFSGTYPEYVYSTLGAYNEISGNTVTGVNSNSTIGITSTLNFLDNVITAGDSGSSVIDILWPRGNKVAVIEGNKFRNTLGQFNLSITSPDSIRIRNNSRYGAAPTVGGGAMVSVNPSVVDASITENYTENTSVIRFLGAGPYTIDALIGNISRTASLFLPPTGTMTIKNYINNAYTSQSMTGVTATQNVGNLALIS